MAGDRSLLRRLCCPAIDRLLASFTSQPLEASIAKPDDLESITCAHTNCPTKNPCTKTTFRTFGAGYAAAAVPWIRVLAAIHWTPRPRIVLATHGRIPLPEIEVSHFKGSIWLTTSLEGVAIARGTANALSKRVWLTLAKASCCCRRTLASIGIRTIELVRRIVVEAPGIAASSASLSS